MSFRYYLVTLGCPKNEVDSEGIRQLLDSAGHRESPSPEDADILIVNTCAFIQPAIEESVAELGKLAARKKPGQKLVAAGCIGERLGARLAPRVPELDAILGTRRWTQILPLAELLAEGVPLPSILVLPGHLPEVAPPVRRRLGPGGSAYLKIAEGCSAGCAFCTIPFIKGHQRSKPPADILEEARQLTGLGAKELILIAQDTTAYGHDLGMKEGLAQLIGELVRAVPELPWLRVMYAHPQGVSEKLIAALASHPGVCHYLDLPLQHAHPDALRRMGRPHRVEAIYRMLEELRSAMPDMALRTTFIVGYPGETEGEFAALLDSIEEAAFDWTGIFPYYPEEGTKAAELPGQLPPEVKQERYAQAMEAAQRVTRSQNEKQVGRELRLLVEGAGDGLSVGRTYRQAPEVDGLVLMEGEFPPGEMLPVRIKKAIDYDLWAEGTSAPPASGGAPS